MDTERLISDLTRTNSVGRCTNSVGRCSTQEASRTKNGGDQQGRRSAKWHQVGQQSLVPKASYLVDRVDRNILRRLIQSIIDNAYAKQGRTNASTHWRMRRAQHLDHQSQKTVSHAKPDQHGSACTEKHR